MKSLSVAMAVALGVVLGALGYGEQGAVEVDKLVERDGLLYEIDAGEPFTGTAVEYWPGGQRSAEFELRDGVPHGKLITWNESGQKEIEQRYRNGEKHGRAIWWYDNGQKMQKGEYRDGNRHGKWTEWHENGQKSVSAEFLDGKLVKAECRDEQGNPEPCPEWDEEAGYWELKW